MHRLYQLYKPKILIWLGVVVLIVSIGASGYEWVRFLYTPLFPPGTSVAYELKPKTSINHFAEDLHNLQVLNNKKRYLLIGLGYLKGKSHHLKAGEYLLEGGCSPSEILNKIVKGDVIKRHITFVEGWTFAKMLNALEANPYLRHSLSNVGPEEVMQRLGHPGISAEGQFFPDTYVFTRGVSDMVILKKAYALMQTRFNEAWKNRSAEASYGTPYQALIAASIIEKESGFKPERPVIAGVLLNRWRMGMPLQIDSTVSYGLGGVIHLTKTDLTQQTPYNSYLYRGWPPSPIAMPSLNAIQAALHPQTTSYLYFVSTGEGRHHFSVTLDEHHVAVVRYKQHLLMKLHETVTPYLFPLLPFKN